MVEGWGCGCVLTPPIGQGCGEGSRWLVKGLGCGCELTRHDLFQIEDTRVCGDCYGAYCAATYVPDLSSEEGVARAKRCGAGRAAGTRIVAIGHGCGVPLPEGPEEKVLVIGNVPYCVSCYLDYRHGYWVTQADRMLDNMSRLVRRRQEAHDRAGLLVQRDPALVQDYLRVPDASAPMPLLHCDKEPWCTNTYKHRGVCPKRPAPTRMAPLLTSRPTLTNRGGYMEALPEVTPNKVELPLSQPTPCANEPERTSRQIEERRRNFLDAQACLLARFRARGSIWDDPFIGRSLVLAEIMHADFPGDEQTLQGLAPPTLSEADNEALRDGGPGDVEAQGRWLARAEAAREIGTPMEPLARNDGHATSREQAARQERWSRWHAAIRLDEARKAHAVAVNGGEDPRAWCNACRVPDHLVYSPEAHFVRECLGINMFSQNFLLTESDHAQRALADKLEKEEPDCGKALSREWEARSVTNMNANAIRSRARARSARARSAGLTTSSSSDRPSSRRRIAGIEVTAPAHANPPPAEAAVLDAAATL